MRRPPSPLLRAGGGPCRRAQNACAGRIVTLHVRFSEQGNWPKPELCPSLVPFVALFPALAAGDDVAPLQPAMQVDVGAALPARTRSMRCRGASPLRLDRAAFPARTIVQAESPR